MLFLQKLMQRFQTEAESQVIGVVSKCLLFTKQGLVDDATDQDEIAGLDNAGHLVKKAMLVRSGREQAGECSFFFSDLELMQPDQIMPHMVELEFLDSRNDLFAVMSFVKNAKSEHEYRVTGIQLLHSVITAFINIDDGSRCIFRTDTKALSLRQSLATRSGFQTEKTAKQVTRDPIANRC